MNLFLFLFGGLLGGNDSLTLSEFATGTPACGQPSLSQNHSLGPNSLATGSPVVGSAALSHVLDFASLAAGQPVLGSPTLFVESSWWIYWYSFKVMKMQNNQAGQSITMLAIDTATGKPKTGDAANLTAYISKDDGAVTALGDISATETSATNAKGLYTWSLTQAETNAGKLVFSGKSATANVELIPVTVYTTSEIDAAAIAVAVRSELAVELARIDVAISTRTGGGSGGTAYSITVTDGVLPLDGVAVWVTTDEAGTNAIAGPVHTNAMGQAVFALEPGSYYAFCQRSGMNFTNPQPITVA
jgi:hypothetical protein